MSTVTSAQPESKMTSGPDPAADALARSVAAVCEALTPDGPSADDDDLETLVRFASARRVATRSTERMQWAELLIVARTRLGDTDAAVDEGEAMLRAAAGADELALAGLRCAVAEACVSGGSLRRAAELSRRAARTARMLDEPALEFRAEALRSVSLALNGEYDVARTAAARARALQATHSWETGATAYALLLGEILLASANGAPAAIRALAAELAEAPGGTSLWTITAHTAEAMALLLEGDGDRAVQTLICVVNGTDAHGARGMIVGFATGIYADVLLSRGEARRTLTLLGARTSPPLHALCFDMQRAAAHLLLGDDTAALATTDDCMRLGTEHCLRTLPPVLLRRAIAHERLGQHDIADERFAEAFHIVARSHSVTPFLTLPPSTLHGLFDRFEARHGPSAELAAVRARVAALPVVDERRARLPRFTASETRLAAHLAGSASLPAIARTLHLSPNTVKSQARAIYTKLGVASRKDAVTALRYAGFFD